MGEGPVDVDFEGPGPAIATSVLHAAETGTFEGIDYDPELRGHIYREMVYVRPGDHVERLRYGAEALGVVFMKFGSECEMRETLARLPELISVRVSRS